MCVCVCVVVGCVYSMRICVHDRLNARLHWCMCGAGWKDRLSVCVCVCVHRVPRAYVFGKEGQIATPRECFLVIRQ